MEKRVSGNVQLDRRMPEVSPWAQLPRQRLPKSRPRRSPFPAARIDLSGTCAAGRGFLLCGNFSEPLAPSDATYQSRTRVGLGLRVGRTRRRPLGGGGGSLGVVREPRRRIRRVASTHSAQQFSIPTVNEPRNGTMKAFQPLAMRSVTRSYPEALTSPIRVRRVDDSDSDSEILELSLKQCRPAASQTARALPSAPVTKTSANQ